MPRVFLTATILVLFLLEGTVLQHLSPQVWGLSWITVPRFALVGAIMVSFHRGRREGLYYGLVFGFLQDVLFGNVIGVYTLSMMVASYFAGLIVKLFHRSLVVAFMTICVVLFAHEWLLYLLFRLFAVNPVDVQWILSKQILPSVGLNVLFAILVYYPLTKMCEALKPNRHTAGE